VLLIAAAVLNGSVFWLKRIGWLEPQMYQEYLEFLGPNPYYQRTPAENEQLRVLTSRFYTSEGGEVILKLSKDAWLLLFIVVSLILLARHKAGLFSFPPWPLLLFLLLVASSAIYSFFQFGLLMPVAGLRFFSFLGVTLLASWLAHRDQLYMLACGMMLYMSLQFLLAPYELTHGLHMFGAKFFGGLTGDRIVGTMLQPSSLGIAAVLSLQFYLGFNSSRQWIVSAVIITTVLVFFSASAMAILLLFLVAALSVDSRVEDKYRSWLRIITMLGVTGIILLLPEISGRWNIMDSLWGRLLPIELYMEQNNMMTLLFGQGLGVGTNTAANLLMDWQANQAPGYAATAVFIADATPMALIAQLGFVGLLSFYLLLAYAAARDPQALPFYLVAGIASLTTNLPELFPINMVLGMLLARSLFPGKPAVQRRKAETSATNAHKFTRKGNTVEN